MRFRTISYDLVRFGTISYVFVRTRTHVHGFAVTWRAFWYAAGPAGTISATPLYTQPGGSASGGTLYLGDARSGLDVYHSLQRDAGVGGCVRIDTHLVDRIALH